MSTEIGRMMFEEKWKERFGDEFLQRDDGEYTSAVTSEAFYWFYKGATMPSATTAWEEYDPEASPDIMEGCWHLIDCGDRISTSRWCNQRHWLDDDTAVVRRFARVFIDKFATSQQEARGE